MFSMHTMAESPPIILCFGDSLTAGYGVAPGRDYPALLQKHLQTHGFPHRVVNAGLSGDTTAGALQRLGWSLKSKPAIAIVVLGANDGLRGLNLEAMRQNLIQITQQLQAAGVQVILGGMRIPPNYDPEYVARFAAIYPQVAEATQVELIPFFLAGVAGKPQLNQGDGIHPNGDGYRVIAETIWNFLASRLATMQP